MTPAEKHAFLSDILTTFPYIMLSISSAFLAGLFFSFEAYTLGGTCAMQVVGLFVLGHRAAAREARIETLERRIKREIGL